MANVGLYWKSKFRQKLTPIMYAINVYRYESVPTVCPGAFTENNEFDFEADTTYHSENLSAPTCRNGVIGTIITDEITGFYFSDLKQSQMIELNIGTLDENEGVVIFDGYVDLENVVAIEYPTGVYHQFEFKRDLKIGEEVIACYGKVRKSNGIL